MTAEPNAGVSQRPDRGRASELDRPAGSQAGRRVAAAAAAVGAHIGVTDPRPIGVFDSGVGGLTVLREILRRTPASPRSTSATTRGRRTARGRTTRSARFSTESIDALVERDVKAVVVACNTSTAVALGDLRRRYDLPILGVIRPGAIIGVAGDAQPAGRRDRDAGHDPLARLLRRDQGREPGGRGLRARHADVRPDGRGGAARRPGGRGRPCARRSRRSSASATPRGEFVFPLPASARIDTLLLGCTHYPLLRAAIAARRRRARSRSSIPRRPPPPRSRSCSRSTGSRRRAAADGPAGAGAGATHVQLTTGDVDALPVDRGADVRRRVPGRRRRRVGPAPSRVHGTRADGRVATETAP